MYLNDILSSSSHPYLLHVDRGYATGRHEFERNAKPWSELSVQMGPCPESSMTPFLNGETRTRSLDQEVTSTTNQDRKCNDSSTPGTASETTTFYRTVARYIRDILLLTQQS